jgi:hypothetical protein
METKQETNPATEDIMTRINRLKEQYFEINKKNSFFKKSQKLDCAKFIANNMDLNELIEKTVFMIPNTKIIYIDYPIFKYFANEDNYERIVQYIINLFDYAIKYYGNYIAYLNLDSFTVSSTERYIPAVKIFCNICLSKNNIYMGYIDKFFILNRPAVMEAIITVVKPFVERDVIDKLTFLTKEQTKKFLENGGKI